jgi:hypothetical protein
MEKFYVEMVYSPKTENNLEFAVLDEQQKRNIEKICKEKIGLDIVDHILDHPEERFAFLIEVKDELIFNDHMRKSFKVKVIKVD